MIVIPGNGAAEILDLLTDTWETWYHLYTNDVALSVATALTDFTEASWPGYAPVQVKTWSPALYTGGVATTSADPVQWTFGEGGLVTQVYGYYVTDTQGGALLWAEAVPSGPVPMRTPADQVAVLPTFNLCGGQCPPPSAGSLSGPVFQAPKRR